MSMIEILKRTKLTVNTDQVSSFYIMKVNYGLILVVKMYNGDEYTVQHEPKYPLGDDVYAVHDKLSGNIK